MAATSASIAMGGAESTDVQGAVGGRESDVDGDGESSGSRSAAIDAPIDALHAQIMKQCSTPIGAPFVMRAHV